jgi:hypothetical protein
MPAESAITRSRRIFIIAGYAVIIVAFLAIGVIPYFRSVAGIKTSIEANQRELDARVNARQQLDQVNS